MILESVTECPLCSQSNFCFYITCQDHTTTKETFNLQKCSHCSFVFTSPRPSLKNIAIYYQSDSYISHTGTSKSIVDKIYHLVRIYSLNQKRKLLSQFSSKGSLLDYGSGTGEFLNHCSQHGWDAEGIEPSELARLKAIKMSSLKIHQQLKELTNKKFSAITLWHVLEHVHDLNQVLHELIIKLSEDGVLYIAVPNHNSYDARKYRNYWAGYDVPRHLWHFKKENIKQLIAKHGLTLVDIKPMIFDSFYVSILSEKYLNPKAFGIGHLIRGMIAGLISNIKAHKDMNYSSLIYILKK
jgi:SAM-dependent methyltransferase